MNAPFQRVRAFLNGTDGSSWNRRIIEIEVWLRATEDTVKNAGSNEELDKRSHLGDAGAVLVSQLEPVKILSRRVKNTVCRFGKAEKRQTSGQRPCGPSIYEQFPKLFSAVGSAWESTGHTNDGDGLETLFRVRHGLAGQTNKKEEESSGLRIGYFWSTLIDI